VIPDVTLNARFVKAPEANPEPPCSGGPISAIYPLIPIPQKGEDLISIYLSGLMIKNLRLLKQASIADK
jgi:hypothetical protein